MINRIFSFMNVFRALIVMIEIYFVATCVRSLLHRWDGLTLLFLLLFSLILLVTIAHILVDKDRRNRRR